MGTMGEGVRRGLAARLLGRLGLAHPVLFLLFAALLAADLVIPDLVPFADELGLALLTALFASWRSRREQRRSANPPAAPPPADEGCGPSAGK